MQLEPPDSIPPPQEGPSRHQRCRDPGTSPCPEPRRLGGGAPERSQAGERAEKYEQGPKKSQRGSTFPPSLENSEVT